MEPVPSNSVGQANWEEWLTNTSGIPPASAQAKWRGISLVEKIVECAAITSSSTLDATEQVVVPDSITGSTGGQEIALVEKIIERTASEPSSTVTLTERALTASSLMMLAGGSSGRCSVLERNSLVVTFALRNAF